MRNPYQRPKIKAAERDTSVNAEGSDLERRKRLQKQVLASVRRFRAADRLDREAIHDRKALR